MRTWTFPEVHPPGKGPWENEPDKAQWIDPNTDLDCLIVRARVTGALCGYVGTPPGHPWHERVEVNAEVHGGVTFTDFCMEGAEDGPGVCHIPETGRPANVWWVGFDCAHAWDVSPTLNAQFPDLNLAEALGGTYRDFGYVRQQVTILALQAKLVALKGRERRRFHKRLRKRDFIMP